jgi:cobalt transporter subunit CbtA
MPNIAVFKRILFAAVLAGLIAGLLLTAVQQLQVVPVILEAERYERAALSEAGLAASSERAHGHHHEPAGMHNHSHASAQDAVPGHVHEAGHSHAQSPPDGNRIERTSLTALVNISLAVGFGLLLGAAFSLREHVPDWRAGVLWGLGGYAAFFIAPSLGLPPGLPGAEAAPLAERQTWWLLTVLATGTGLSLIAFAPRWVMKLIGVLLLVLPHALGAPDPAVEGGVAPVELAQTFLIATAIANAAFWLALGGLTGFFYRRVA